MNDAANRYLLTPIRTSIRRGALLPIATLLLLTALPSATAQVVTRPSLGLQTLAFLGEPAAAQPISPGPQRELPLGGGMSGAQTGARLQIEVMSSEKSILRFPLSVEYFALDGKTTFMISSRNAERKRRLTFTHDGQIATVNLGVTAAFLTLPKLYVSGELKGVYFFPTNLNARIYYLDNDETIQEQDVEPFGSAFRIGGFLKAGAQVAFFEPLLLDFSAGIGSLNLLMKETDPAEQRNLLIVDTQRRDPEGALQYFSIGLGVIWKL